MFIIRSSNPKKSEDWIAQEHQNNFVSWLRLQIMDQDAGVQLVDTNPYDIEILQILASGPSTRIHGYTSYDINGYTFYTRAQDNKKTNQNSGVQTDAYDYDGNRETFYGFIEDIWELEYIENLKVPLFQCQWIRLPNGVKINKYGMTNVSFRFLGYRE
jgi:glycogen debranching enzyme